MKIAIQHHTSLYIYILLPKANSSNISAVYSSIYHQASKKYTDIAAYWVIEFRQCLWTCCLGRWLWLGFPDATVNPLPSSTIEEEYRIPSQTPLTWGVGMWHSFTNEIQSDVPGRAYPVLKTQTLTSRRNWPHVLHPCSCPECGSSAWRQSGHTL